MDESNTKSTKFYDDTKTDRRNSYVTISKRRSSLSETDLNQLQAKRRQSLGDQLIGMRSVDVYKNPHSTNYVIKCSSPKEAHTVTKVVEDRVDGYKDIIPQAKRNVVRIQVENQDCAAFEASFKTEASPLLRLQERLQGLENEVISLQQKGWLKRVWYGLPTKQGKIAALKQLISAIEQHPERNAGQHCQTIRKAYPVVVTGFFSHRTRNLFNQIENEARKPALDAYIEEKAQRKTLRP